MRSLSKNPWTLILETPSLPKVGQTFFCSTCAALGRLTHTSIGGGGVLLPAARHSNAPFTVSNNPSVGDFTHGSQTQLLTPVLFSQPFLTKSSRILKQNTYILLFSFPPLRLRVSPSVFSWQVQPYLWFPSSKIKAKWKERMKAPSSVVFWASCTTALRGPVEWWDGHGATWTEGYNWNVYLRESQTKPVTTSG